MLRLVLPIMAHGVIGIVVLALLVLVRPALAITHQEEHEMLAGKISEKQAQLSDSLAVLKSKPQEEWSQLEIQNYLSNALWVVHYGILQYVCDEQQLPSQLELLAGTEYIPFWPENPFNSFAPMRILNDIDGFQAGELVLMICPPEYYSRIALPRPLSYELAVYGPDIEFAHFGHPEVAPGNDKWAVVPEGALYMTGMFTESGKHLKEKVQKQKAAETAKAK